jgi:SHS2 domain-containing protein
MTADLVARGTTLREAFAQASLAVLGQAVDPAAVEPRDVREVRAHGATPEALLRTWIAECCYVHELESFACHAIDWAVFDAEAGVGGEPLRVHGFLRGEEIDTARHGASGTIRVPRGISIDRTPEGYEIRLMLES